MAEEKLKNVWAEKLKNVWSEKNVFGLKRELFWAEKNVFGLKRRAHVNQKKRKGGLKQKWGAETQTEKGKGGAALKERKKKAETEKGCWSERAEQRIFQHLFSFKSSQKNYGEFIYVEFNF